jgi:hypothetical protein
MENQLVVGTKIGDRTVSALCHQDIVDDTLVTVVQFIDGSFGVVTSGDREPDLWPVGDVAARFIGTASEIRDLALVRESGEPFPYVSVLGVRNGHNFMAMLFFGMWPEKQPEDRAIRC